MASASRAGREPRRAAARGRVGWSACFRARRLEECERLAQELARDVPTRARPGVARHEPLRPGDLAAAVAIRRAAASSTATAIGKLGTVLHKPAITPVHARRSGRLSRSHRRGRHLVERRGQRAGRRQHRRGATVAGKAASLAPQLARLAAARQRAPRLQRTGEAEAALREALRIQPAIPRRCSASARRWPRRTDCAKPARPRRRRCGSTRIARAHVNLGRFATASVTRRPRANTTAGPASWIGKPGSWSSELYCRSDASVDAQEVFDAHKAFGEQAEARSARTWRRMQTTAIPGADCVGVVSVHSAIIRWGDPGTEARTGSSQVQLVAYDSNPAADAMAQRLHALVDAGRRVDALRRCTRGRIRADGIDMLIDIPGTRPATPSAYSPASPRRCRCGRLWARACARWITGCGAGSARRLPPVHRTPRPARHARVRQPGRLPALTPPPLARSGPSPRQLQPNEQARRRGDRCGRKLRRTPVEARARCRDRRCCRRGAARALRGPRHRDGRIAFLPRLDMADYLAAHERIDLLLDAFRGPARPRPSSGCGWGPTLTWLATRWWRTSALPPCRRPGWTGSWPDRPRSRSKLRCARRRSPELRRLRASLRNRLEEDARRSRRSSAGAGRPPAPDVAAFVGACSVRAGRMAKPGELMVDDGIKDAQTVAATAVCWAK